MQSVITDTTTGIAANKRYQNQRSDLVRNLAETRKTICDRAEKVYDINGLLDQVPPEWNCPEFYRRSSE